MTILAIDVGSSSVRAMLFEADDSRVQLIPDALVQGHYTFDSDNSGRATVDAVFLRELLEQCLDEILAHDAASSINAVGMATFVGNLLLCDGNNQPIVPLDTYADTRSDNYVDVLSREMDVSAHHQTTGTILNSAYWLPKLRFYDYPHNAEPFVLHFCDFATYCYQTWFGRDVPMTYSVASWSGMLNRENLDWDEESIRVSGCSREMFPDLADFSEAQEGLSADYASRWGKLADIPFYLAVGDGAAAQIGSGAITDNTAALTIGTTAAIRTVSTAPLPHVPAGCWSYRIDKNHHLTGGALSEGGNIFDWARKTLDLDGINIEDELLHRTPGSHDLTIVPLLNGERSPGWRSDATGTIHGLRLSTTPMDILHALLESVALRLAIIIKQLNLAPDIKMMATGGALHHSQVWSQMIATASGRELHLIGDAEATATGLAWMVHSVQRGGNITDYLAKVTRIFKPETNHSVIFEGLQARQRDLYRQTEDLQNEILLSR